MTTVIFTFFFFLWHFEFKRSLYGLFLVSQTIGILFNQIISRQQYLSILLSIFGLLLAEWRIWYVFGFSQVKRSLEFSANLGICWIPAIMMHWILLSKQSMQRWMKLTTIAIWEGGFFLGWDTLNRREIVIMTVTGVIFIALFEFCILFRFYGHFMIYRSPLNLILVSFGVYALPIGSITTMFLGAK